MARAVYSTRFIVLHGGSFGQYTVAAGFIAVVRDVDTYASSEFGESIVFLQGSSGQAMWQWQSGLGQESYGSWRGRQVIFGDESFNVTVEGVACDATVSGYLLTAP